MAKKASIAVREEPVEPVHLSTAENTRDEPGAKFVIDGKSLSLLSTLVSMKGSFTSSSKEKKKEDFLFSEFGGKIENNVLDVVMSNKTKNVCANLKFTLAEGSVLHAGSVWCGEMDRFVRYCTKIAMKGKITVQFKRSSIVFTDEDEVSSEMRNVDHSTLDYVKQAKTMLTLLELGQAVKYNGVPLGTSVKIDFADLKPVIADASVIENYNYPITVKQGDSGFVVYFEIVDDKKMNKIYRPIKNVEVEGQECHSEYVVGIDSMIGNLSGKATMHMSDWSPLVVQTVNPNYEHLMVLAPMKKSDETSSDDYDFEEEDDESDEEEVFEADDSDENDDSSETEEEDSDNFL